MTNYDKGNQRIFLAKFVHLAPQFLDQIFQYIVRQWSR